jgi:hypothetical protein
VNVDETPEAFAELRRVGVPLVPAVVVGDRAVHGWNPEAYAALLGVAYRSPTKLAPAELALRLDTVLDATERLLRVLTREQTSFRPPERDRSLGNLGYHVFRLAIAFADGMDGGEFPEGWLQESAPPSLTAPSDVADYGSDVRRRLGEWFARHAPAAYDRVIAVYYGPQTGHDLLERTTWHAAQHLRQLYDLAARLAVRPPVPFPAAALEGLPLPAAIW